LFEVLDLADDADRPIAGYSHGMRKKTALAAALLARPQLLMLDEPFEGVDPVSTRAMRRMLDQFRAGGGTVVLSTHVMDIVERVCDEVGVIHHGRLVASGPIDELRAGRRLEDAFIDVVGAEDVDGGTLDWLG
jgi:ABC-2 type transport system ATP-binding protein